MIELKNCTFNMLMEACHNIWRTGIHVDSCTLNVKRWELKSRDLRRVMFLLTHVELS